MKAHRFGWLVVCAVALAACGSSPQSDYYRLVPLVDEVPGKEEPVLGVGPVTVSDYLQRPEMVTSDQGTRLRREEFHRWGEPLDVGVARVVAINLASLVDTHRVYVFPWRRSEVPDYGLRLQVLQFDIEAGDARLVVEWQLSRLTDKAMIEQRLAVYHQPVQSGEPAEVPVILSQLLLQLSRQVADVIKAQPALTALPAAAPEQE